MSERSTNRVTPPRSTGICSSLRRRSRPVAAVDHPAYRLGEPLGAHRLEHVVDGVQVERLDRVLLVGGHEHDRRRRPEAGQHLGQLEPGQAGHLDVEEDRVDLGSCEDPQRLGRRVAGEHVADPRRRAEQEGQLVERRPLVVDDQHPQAGRCGSRVHPRRELRHPHDHLGARAGRGLDDQAVVVAERVAQPASTLPRPTESRAGVAGERAAYLLGVLARRRRPRPRSRTPGPRSRATIVMWPLRRPRPRARAGRRSRPAAGCRGTARRPAAPPARCAASPGAGRRSGPAPAAGSARSSAAPRPAS